MAGPSPIALIAQIGGVDLIEIHRLAGWWVAGYLGVVGLLGIAIAISRREPGRTFFILLGIGMAAILIQVGLGLYGFSVEDRQPGNIHVFYGVVLMFTLAFAYIYRAQLARRAALSYGLLALFLMGVGIRAIGNIGQSFGG